MAAIDALLDGPRAQRAFLLKAMFEGAWSITIEDEAPLSVVVLAQGSAVFTGSDGVAHQLGPGDVVLARGPAPYVFADAADRPADIRILPGQVCVDPHGQVLPEDMFIGVRTWGNTRSPDATVMLIGTYERETSVGALLLSRLPASVVLHGFDPALTTLLATELSSEEAGHSVVLDRLLDLVVVTALRDVLATGPARPADETVARALAAIEERPELPWTVESLGAHVGLSRAALARRFGQHVGEPPLTYLTRWRLALAADLLAGSDLPLAAIATRVGYASPFALSAAFKRAHGMAPATFRRAQVAS
ncbi:MAG: AraC family transcriptional regulator [Nocardioidaceae bacterium]|nr:AraC family transcriptional regulator [Nocardioidaceae bacterium]